MARGTKKRLKPRRASSQVRDTWRFRFAAIVLSVVGLLFADILVRVAGWLPPEDPLVFLAKSYEEAFVPFSDAGGGMVAIKPEWINEGETLAVRRGEREGQLFLLPAFRPATFARSKPVGTFRIFVLGGSTTFGLGVGAENAFAGQLRDALARKFPIRSVEVINLGCPGWASDRVAGLIPELLELSPDLLVVYSGHNEMLRESAGAGAQLDRLSQMRVRSLRWSSIVAWMHHGISRWRDREVRAILQETEVAAVLAGQSPVFDPILELETRSLPDPELLEGIAAQYADNLRRMAGEARGAGVPILFVLPVSNLLFPPAYSTHPHGTDEEAFEELLASAQKAFEEDRLDESLHWIGQAIASSPRYGMAHHWRGLVVSRLGRMDEAARELQLAVDHDLRPHRMTSGLIEAFIDSMEETHAPWIDLRPLFYRNPDLKTAETLFLDHLHPTRYGHQLIAEALLAHTEALVAAASETGSH